MYINCNSSSEVQSAINLYTDFCELLADVPHLLAGGAPRDIFFNRVPSDFDIYVPVEYFEQINFNKELEAYLINAFTNQYDHQYIKAIDNYMYAGYSFQLIFVSRDFDSVINSFSCSLSKIYYKDGLLHPSKVFINSWLDSVLYFNRNISESYYNKIRRKFPSFIVRFIE